MLREMLTSEACSRLVLALLHSLWMGGIVWLLLWPILRNLPAKRAIARYAACLAALLLVALSVPATYGVPDRRATPVVPVSGEHQGSVISQPKPSGATATPASVYPAAKSSLDWSTIAAGCWGCGVALMLARVAGSLIGARGLVARGQPANQPELLDGLAAAQRRLEWQRAIRVVVVDGLLSPAVVGILRPVLLVPASIACSMPAEQLEAIFLHELAHLRRHDYLVNLGQMLIEAALFFNPAVWWISRQVRIEREACCDALAAGAADHVQLARALERIGAATALRMPHVTMAADGNGKLLDRIRRLLVPGYRPGMRMSIPGAVLAIVSATILFAGIWKMTEAATGAVAEMLSPQERVDQIAEMQKKQAISNGPVVIGSAHANGTIITEDDSPVPESMTVYGKAEMPGVSTLFQLGRKGDQFDGPIAAGQISLYTYDGNRMEFVPATWGPQAVKAGQDLKDIKLILRKGFVGKVRIVGTDGGIAAATIETVYSMPGGQEIGRKTLFTDDSGWLTIPAVGEVPLSVRVNIHGYQEDSMQLKLAPGKPAEWRLAPARVVTGIVQAQADGKAIVGARIIMMWNGSQSWHPRSEDAPVLATTDASGRFSLDTLHDNANYSLCILADGYSPQLIYDVTPRNATIEAKLKPAVRIRGTIKGTPEQLSAALKPDGAGLGSVSVSDTVRVRPESSHGRQVTVPVTIAGNEARFEFSGLVPGTTRILIGNGSREIDASKSVDGLVIDLNNGPGGIPAPRIRQVRLRIQPPQGSPIPQGAVDVAAFLAKAPPEDYRTRSSVPLKDGVAAFEAVVGKSFGYETGKLSGYWVESKDSIAVPDGEAPLVLDVTAYPAGAVHGTVRLADGRPAVNATISLVTVKRPTREGLQQQLPSLQPVQCDAEGQYVLSPCILGGTYCVVATPQRSDAAIIGTPFDITLDRPIAVSDLQMRPGVDVHVRVVGPSGEPLAGVPAAFMLDTNYSYGFGFGQRTTDSDGRVMARELDPLWPGTLVLTLKPSAQYQSKTVEVKIGDSQQQVVLQLGSKFAGQVVDDASGKPVPGVGIRLFPKPPATGIPDIETMTDAEGRFAFTTLAPITYWVYISDCHPPGATFTQNPDGSHRVSSAGAFPNAEPTKQGEQVFRVAVAPWKR